MFFRIIFQLENYSDLSKLKGNFTNRFHTGDIRSAVDHGTITPRVLVKKQNFKTVSRNKWRPGRSPPRTASTHSTLPRAITYSARADNNEIQPKFYELSSFVSPIIDIFSQNHPFCCNYRYIFMIFIFELP